jgi:energy-converting hydrogenase Eha subunit A
MKRIKQAKEYKIEYGMIVFSICSYLIGILLGQPLVPFLFGIIFGLIVSLLKLKLMEKTFSKAVEMSFKKAQSYTTTHYFIRYVLTGVALAVAALLPYMSLLGAFIGVMSMKAGAYGAMFFQKSNKKSE